MTLSPRYVIPRKTIQCVMQELGSEVSRKDTIDIFYNSFKRQQQKDYLIESVYSIENAELIRNFKEVRTQLRVVSQPNTPDSNFNYGFMEVPNLKQAELVAKSGVVPRRQASSIYLGTDVHGLFLCIHGDYTSKEKPLPTSSHFIIVCQLALNIDCVQWINPISDKNEQPPSFPTNRTFGANMYLIGCHSAVRSLCQIQQDPAWAESFEAGLIYLWDFDGQFRPILAPRHCLPVAVIHYTYQGSPYLPPTENTLSLAIDDSSHATPTPSQHYNNQLVNKNTTVSQPMRSVTLSIDSSSQERNTSCAEQLASLSTKKHATNPLTHTDKPPCDSIFNSLLQSEHNGDKILLWKRFKEAAMSASQLWSGVLYNGEHRLCPIKLITYYPPSFSLHFSELINIELATSFELFYKEFPRGLFTSAYPMLYDSKLAYPIVIKNNSIHYAEAYPSGGAAISILNALISYLQEKKQVAYGHIDEFTRIYFIPTSHLTQHLKVTHPSHPNILHVLIYRLIQPTLSSSGVSTSPQPSVITRIIKPIPTHITPRDQGQNDVCDGHVPSTGPYPFILQRIPLITTRTIGTQCVSPFKCKCQCGASTTVDVACQTTIDSTKEEACQTVPSLYNTVVN